MDLINEHFPIVEATYNTEYLPKQLINVSAFTLMLLMNSPLNMSLFPTSVGDIARSVPSKISAAGWAFGIWGFIYLLVGSFTVYQVLPDDWVPSRNNTLIFDEMGYWIPANFLLNGLWLVLFLSNSTFTSGLALLDMIVLLTTCRWIMYKSTNAKVNLFEGITLRGGFTIYAGWITAAMILSASQFLMQLGLVDPNIPYGFNEENISQIIMWVALVIYNLVAWGERNPLYGSVFIWAASAIKSNLLTLHPELTSLIGSLTTIIDI